MCKDKQEAGIGLPEIDMSLDELISHGARQVIEQGIELELAALLEQYANVRALSGKQAVVRNLCRKVRHNPRHLLAHAGFLRRYGPVSYATCRVPERYDDA